MQTPLQFLKGDGPRKAADLKKAGIDAFTFTTHEGEEVAPLK